MSDYCPPYTTLTARHTAELVAICDSERVIEPGSRKLDRYSKDKTFDSRYARLPEAVVFPQTTDEVCRIVAFASTEQIPVTPRGGGTGLSGGCVPVHGGIVMSFEKMNRIIEIDTDNLVATVEPGVITRKLDDALRPHGLFFAGYPMSEQISTIGGNVAENAGGGRAVKYGVTGNYVLGIEAVRADGRKLVLGGKRLKDVTGYNLLSTIIGSEGTLAVVTKIHLRLLPRPVARHCILALFEDTGEAISAVSSVIRESRVRLSAAEFMDATCTRAACEMLKETIPYEQYGPLLLFEVDGHSQESVIREARVIASLLESLGAWTRLAESEAENERFWKIRKQGPWALNRMKNDQSHEDITLPVASVAPMMQRLETVAEEFGVRIPAFGHAADGNLHAVPIRPDDMSQERWDSILPDVLRTMYRAARELGGTISGEHGIGHKRIAYLDEALDPVALEMMHAIKKALDPDNILNPGKIFAWRTED